MRTLSPYTQAALLLAAQFGKTAEDSPKPLSPTEWERFSTWLRDRGVPLADLLGGGAAEILEGSPESGIHNERIHRLLDRGTAMGVAVEKWARSGVWIISDADPDYPRSLKTKLGGRSPAILFGCGDRRLLKVPCWAVVGSRRTSKEDLEFATRLGARTADSGRALISGGAKGVDQAAVQGALKAEGTAIAILADSLLKAVLSRQYRAALQRKDLLLVSPYYPEAGFSPGNAMGRNKYVYCMAELAVVVHSGTSGGTWTGAKEAMRKGFCPVWVKRNEDPEAGNEALVREGGNWLPEDALEEGVLERAVGRLGTASAGSERESTGPQLSVFDDLDGS